MSGSVLKLWFAMEGILTKVSVGDGMGVSGWPLVTCSCRWPLVKWSDGPWSTACWIELDPFPGSLIEVDVEDAIVVEDSDDAPIKKSKFKNA